MMNDPIDYNIVEKVIASVKLYALLRKHRKAKYFRILQKWLIE